LEKIPGVEVVVADYLDGRGKFAQFKSHKTIEEYAKIVEQCYLQTKNDFPGIPIMVVGHSLGGIIARLLCNQGYFPSRDMVLVGTPNGGITYKFLGGPIAGLFLLPLFWVLSLKSIFTFNVPAFRQLLKGSDFLWSLNLNGIPKDAYFVRGLKDRLPRWSSDPHGTGIAVSCDHHLFPFNGKRLENLNSKEFVELNKSAIPVVIRIVEKRLAEIKTAAG
jgi:pimeloyl-ACP methyl ester carboxylesterase